MQWGLAEGSLRIDVRGRVPSGFVLGGVPAPMLARLERKLPQGEPWRYEPKLDGFRGLLGRTRSGSVHLLSRNLKDLGPAFPELVEAARHLPCGTLLDGEIIIADAQGRSNFGALQERLGVARRDARLAATRMPAVLLAFDLTKKAGDDLTGEYLCERRGQIEALLQPGLAHLQLVAQTSSVVEAEEWLALVPGLERVVAKRSDSRYLPGQREWIKVKKQRTADCVVIGIAGSTPNPPSFSGFAMAMGVSTISASRDPQNTC
jgi:ATP-dependent DNA ligase